MLINIKLLIHLKWNTNQETSLYKILTDRNTITINNEINLIND